MANISLPMHPPMLPAVIRQVRFQLTHSGPEVDKYKLILDIAISTLYFD